MYNVKHNKNYKLKNIIEIINIMAQIVTFRIIPYSDNVANYINSLSKEDIYKIFRENIGADVLTAALYAIFQLESMTYNSLKNKDQTGNSFNKNISSQDNLQFIEEIPKDLHRFCSDKSMNYTMSEQLANVYLRDKLLFDENINELGIYPNVFVLIINGVYSGHAYSWTIKNPEGPGYITNIVGIRSSVNYLLANKCKIEYNGIINIFLNAIQILALRENKILLEAKKEKIRDFVVDDEQNHYLRILQPIKSITNILTKYGFVIGKSFRNQEQMDWLFNNSSIGDTTLANQLIFRDYDYVMPITNKL